jgi:hypothetical protein
VKTGKGWYRSLTEEQRERIRARARKSYRANHEARLAKQRKNRTTNREEWNAKMRAYQRKNRDKYYEYNAANRFGVTRSEIQAINATASVCEICGNPPNGKKRLAIDHDHDTGKLRGMLCHTCNLGLGAFKDNEVLLHKAFFYLMKHKPVADVG